MQRNDTDKSEPQFKLTAAKETAEALISGSTITEASTASGVDRSTVHRWLREPDFLAFYNSRRREDQKCCHGKAGTPWFHGN